MSAEARGHAPHAPGIDASGLPPLTSPCPALACCLWLASSPGLLVPGSAGQTVTLLVPAFAGMPPEARRADSARADLTSGLKARPRPGAMIRQMRQADAPGRDSSDPKRWLSAPLPALSWSADPALRSPGLLPDLPSCRHCPSCRSGRLAGPARLAGSADDAASTPATIHSTRLSAWCPGMPGRTVPVAGRPRAKDGRDWTKQAKGCPGGRRTRF